MPNAELTGRRRQDARPGPQTMYRVPAARAWWSAVGAPVERPVRHQLPYFRSMNSFMPNLLLIELLVSLSRTALSKEDSGVVEL